MDIKRKDGHTGEDIRPWFSLMGTEITYIILFSSILYSQQPSEVIWAGSVWLARIYPKNFLGQVEIQTCVS